MIEVAVGNVVTISATYGAGGSIVGPAIAERLGLPFYDRAIPVTIAHKLAVTVDEALAHDERAPSRIDRLVGAFGNAANPLGYGHEQLFENRERFREETEEVLH